MNFKNYNIQPNFTFGILPQPSQSMTKQPEPNMIYLKLFQVRKFAEVQNLIKQNTTGRQFGILGEPHVNVLKINLALDKSSK